MTAYVEQLNRSEKRVNLIEGSLQIVRLLLSNDQAHRRGLASFADLASDVLRLRIFHHDLLLAPCRHGAELAFSTKLSFNDPEKRNAHIKAGAGWTIRKSLSFDGGGQFFFLINCHRESAQILLDVYQIRRQSEAEHHGKNRHEIDDGASRFESPGFELCACAPIAVQTSKRQNNPSNDRYHSEPYRQTRRRLRMALRLGELPNGDREASDCKSKYDHRQARAHPGKKRALLRQVIASAHQFIRL